MLKSNTNAFKAKVESYIIDGLSDPDNNNATTRDILKAFYNDYCRVQDTCIFNQKQVIDFLWCLPNYIHFDYTTFGQRQLLKSWYEQTDKQSEKYSDEQVTKGFMYQLYYSIVTLMIKNDIF